MDGSRERNMSRSNPARMDGFSYLVSIVTAIVVLITGILLMHADYTDYTSIFHKCLIILGVCIIILSVGGLVSVRSNEVNGLVTAYFMAMPFLLVGLFVVILLSSIYIHKGSGRPVLNRAYQDYYLEDYSGWLKHKVANDNHWGKVKSFIHDSQVCAKTSQLIADYPEMEYTYSLRKLNPIQSGCCKPPTECRYTYVNETVWNPPMNETISNPMNTTNLPGNPDCYWWNNDQQKLCYDCNSCKAAVLQSLKNRWKMISNLNICALCILTITYIVGACKQADNSNTHANNRCGSNSFWGGSQQILNGICQVARGCGLIYEPCCGRA